MPGSAGRILHMDPVTERAIADYDKLLRERELSHDLEDHFVERMKAARLTFGGRLLCPFLRPHFVSPATYEQVRNVCRGIFRAIEKVEAGLGPELWDLVDLTPAERELVRDRPRLRAQLPHLAPGLVHHDVRLPVRRAERGEPGRHRVRRGADGRVPGAAHRAALPGEVDAARASRPARRLLKTLVDCYREAGGREEHPVIAIVDYEDVPTRTEHHMFRDFFSERGYPAFVCDPRDLTYEDGALRFEGRPIDIVYKRLLVNELLERIDQLQALSAGGARAAGHDREPVPLQAHPQEGDLRGADRRVAADAASTRTSARPSPRTCPGRGACAEGRTTHAGDSRSTCCRFVRANRDRLVMKPNDEYGGKGVFIGWEMQRVRVGRGAGGRRSARRTSCRRRSSWQRQSFPELARGRIDPLPRPRGRPRPVRVPGRGRGLPDASVRHRRSRTSPPAADRCPRSCSSRAEGRPAGTRFQPGAHSA